MLLKVQFAHLKETKKLIKKEKFEIESNPLIANDKSVYWRINQWKSHRYLKNIYSDIAIGTRKETVISKSI